MKKNVFSRMDFWLPKIPLLSLIFVFLLPIILISINYDLGLFFIAFYISYWSVKVFSGYFHIFRSYRRLRVVNRMSFEKNKLIEVGAKNLKHIVILPIYTEPKNVIEDAVKSLLANDYIYKENIVILLATESRAPNAEKYAKYIIEKYKNEKIRIVNIVHPADIPGE